MSAAEADRKAGKGKGSFMTDELGVETGDVREGRGGRFGAVGRGLRRGLQRLRRLGGQTSTPDQNIDPDHPGPPPAYAPPAAATAAEMARARGVDLGMAGGQHLDPPVIVFPSPDSATSSRASTVVTEENAAVARQIADERGARAAMEGVPTPAYTPATGAVAAELAASVGRSRAPSEPSDRSSLTTNTTIGPSSSRDGEGNDGGRLASNGAGPGRDTLSEDFSRAIKAALATVRAARRDAVRPPTRATEQRQIHQNEAPPPVYTPPGIELATQARRIRGVPIVDVRPARAPEPNQKSTRSESRNGKLETVSTDEMHSTENILRDYLPDRTIRQVAANNSDLDAERRRFYAASISKATAELSGDRKNPNDLSGEREALKSATRDRTRSPVRG